MFQQEAIIYTSAAGPHQELIARGFGIPAGPYSKVRNQLMCEAYASGQVDAVGRLVIWGRTSSVGMFLANDEDALRSSSLLRGHVSADFPGGFDSFIAEWRRLNAIATEAAVGADVGLSMLSGGSARGSGLPPQTSSGITLDDVLRDIVNLSLPHAVETQLELAEWVIEEEEHRVGVVEEVAATRIAFGTHWQRLVEALRVQERPAWRDGPRWLDETAAALVDAIGPAGAEAAAAIRDGSTARFHLSPTEQDSWVMWSSTPSIMLMAEFFARVVWRDLVRPIQSPVARSATSAAAAETKTPALSRAVLDRVNAALFAAQRTVRRVGGVDTIVGADRRSIVGHVKVPGSVTQDDLAAIARLAGHRLFRFLIHQCFAQAVAPHYKKKRITINGGFKGLAELLGLKGSKAQDELRRALVVMSNVAIELPHGETECLVTSWSVMGSAPRRPAVLNITCGDALGPNYVNGLKKNTDTQREARRLVPVPAELPPMVGNPQWHSRLALLQLLVLKEFRDSALAVLHDRVAHLPEDRWLELLREAEVSRDMLPDILSAWTGGTSTTGAFLERGSASETFALSKNYEAALVMIAEGGQQMQRGHRQQQSTRRAKARRSRTNR